MTSLQRFEKFLGVNGSLEVDAGSSSIRAAVDVPPTRVDALLEPSIWSCLWMSALFRDADLHSKQVHHMCFWYFLDRHVIVDQAEVFKRTVEPVWKHDDVTLALPMFSVKAEHDPEYNSGGYDVVAGNEETKRMMDRAFHVLSVSELSYDRSAPYTFTQGRLGVEGLWTNETPDILDQSTGGDITFVLQGKAIGMAGDEQVRMTMRAGFGLSVSTPEFGRTVRVYSLRVHGTAMLTQLIVRALACAGRVGVEFWGGGVVEQAPFTTSPGPMDDTPWPYVANTWAKYHSQRCVGRMIAKINQTIEWYKVYYPCETAATLDYFLHPLIDVRDPFRICHDPVPEMLPLTPGRSEPSSDRMSDSLLLACAYLRIPMSKPFLPSQPVRFYDSFGVPCQEQIEYLRAQPESKAASAWGSVV